MKCPFCGFEESKVIDSRPTDEGERIRRRRECTKCGKRFTTYEVIENVIVPYIGDTKRIIIAINQCDLALKGRYWNYDKSHVTYW